MSATVEGPPAEPLTASFVDVPSTHDGKTAFAFELRFSESVEGLSYRTLRDEAFEVDGGAVRKARRLNPRVNGEGDNQRWEITVKPESHGAVTVRLPAGAVETADGRQLERARSATVAGPVGIAVADARVDEGAGAVAGLRGVAQPCGERHDDGGLRDDGRQRAVGRGLHGGEWHAHVPGG